MSGNQEKDIKKLMTQGDSVGKEKMSNLFKGLIAGKKNQMSNNQGNSTPYFKIICDSYMTELKQIPIFSEFKTEEEKGSDAQSAKKKDSEADSAKAKVEKVQI